MSWRQQLNDLLRRSTGYQLTRARPAPLGGGAPAPAGPVQQWSLSAGRLVTSPIFVLTSVRSGSTLLRVILDTHTEVHATHELHLRDLKADFSSPYVRQAMAALGLTERDVEHLLWDRLLGEQLALSGKRHIADKTPSNALMWRRLVEYWPEARFVFLLRHPASVVSSILAARPDRGEDKAISGGLRFMSAVDEARRELPGLTLRYEDLTKEPERETQRLCEHLGIGWQREMLDYGRSDHSGMERGISDWGEKIRSGGIQPARALPTADEVPRALRDLCRRWGYLS